MRKKETESRGKAATTRGGTPLTRGEKFLGMQMALSLPGKRARATDATAAGGATPAAPPSRASDFTPLVCPRCGRYLVTAVAGASALCPRCGVWAVEPR